MARPVTHVYIDGFNLYYGLEKSCRDPAKQWKWLNPQELSRRLLSEYDVQLIRYFTAVLNPPDWAPAKRQKRFLRALDTLDVVEIHYGRYETYHDELPLAADPTRKVRVLRSEEKQSDVNLASCMILDALVDRAIDVAVLVSNDSDLLMPIALLQEAGVPVVVLNPHLDKPSAHLRQVASHVRSIRAKPVYASQFPDELEDDGGTFTIPPAWRPQR